VPDLRGRYKSNYFKKRIVLLRGSGADHENQQAGNNNSNHVRSQFHDGLVIRMHYEMGSIPVLPFYGSYNSPVAPVFSCFAE